MDIIYSTNMVIFSNYFCLYIIFCKFTLFCLGEGHRLS